LKQMSKMSDVQPDAYSYTTVLAALSRREDKTKSVKKAEEFFEDIEKKFASGASDFRPNTSVYNALINCWAKSGDRKALSRVTQILSLMEELGLENVPADTTLRPNSRTYTAVLDTLARSKNYKAVDISLQILQRMEDYFDQGFTHLRPGVRAYSIVLTCMARAKRLNRKAFKAQEMLHHMEHEYRSGNKACRPNVIAYNSVLNACAFSSKDEKEQEEAFRVACLTFDELRGSSYLKPTDVSYGTFFKTIRKLMPDSDLRQQLVKGLFSKCCKEGLTSDFVLKETGALTKDYQSLLEGVTDYGNLPKSWSENVGKK